MLLLATSCGKGFSDSQSADSQINDISTLQSSASYTLSSKIRLDSTRLLDSRSYPIDHGVRIPASINVQEGNAGNSSAIIYFNARSTVDFSFYCRYVGGANTNSPVLPDQIEKGLSYDFDECFTRINNQDPINYVPGEELIQYKENFVILELLGADSRFKAEASAELELVWH